MNNLFVSTPDFPDIPGCSARTLQADDAANIQPLWAASAGQGLVWCGSQQPDASAALQLKRTADQADEDRTVWGIFADNGQPRAVLVTFRHHPQVWTWYLAFVLTDSDLAEVLYNTYETWAADCGALEIGLQIPQGNTTALAFWQERGFQVVSEPDDDCLELRRTIPVLDTDVI